MSEIVKVMCAEAAYIQDSNEMIRRVERIAPPGSLVVPFYVERTDTEGFICKHDDSAYICISGTESIMDLWQDIKCYPTQFISGYVHKGFSQSIEQVRGPVNALLADMFNGDMIEKIELIGHSLGASIAIGLAPYIDARYRDIEVTTYGCPNGWSDHACMYLDKHFKIKNYVNWCDIVTKLLGFVSGRPGKDIKIHAAPGHSLTKYKKWIWRNT